MAKVKGLVKFTGTIDGMNFYYLNGKLVVRKAGGGFSKRAIKNSPRMEMVRRNNSEFARCARANRELRHAIGPLKGKHKLTFLHSRLQSLLLTTRKLDHDRPKGERRGIVGLCTPDGLSMLRDFDINPDMPLRKALDTSLRFDARNGKVHIDKVDAEKITYPEAATHVRLRAILLQVRPEEDAYKRSASELYTYKRGEEPDSLVLEIPHTHDQAATPIVFLGLRFLQEIDGKLYNLNSKNALAIGVI
jgi:hypothetical protein